MITIADNIADLKRLFRGYNLDANLTFYWGEEGYQQLKNEFATFDLKIPDLKIPEDELEQPIYYCGTKHHWDRSKEGYLLKFTMENNG